jgi:RNA polymerase sigma factor (sigma-70 family)
MVPPRDEAYSTRATLLARLRNWEDQASWQEFFDSYWKLIFGVARKRGLSEAEAQDVVQETMFSVAKQMPTFTYNPAEGSFKAWLLRLTRWRITDQLRKRGPFDTSRGENAPPTTGETTFLENLIDDAGSDQELAAIWEDEWRRNLVQIATSRVKVRLAPDKYQIFDFSVNKGWPSEKIAAAFQIPVDRVYMAKHRITKMIQREVQRLEKDVEQTGRAPAVMVRDGDAELETDAPESPEPGSEKS